MAQHDYVIANQSGAAFRSDLNSALSAIVSQNSGSAAPSTTFAYQLWADTTTGLLKIRNAANNAWVTVGDLATVNLGLASLASPTFTGTVTAPTFTASTAVNVPLGSVTAPSLYITGDTNTGIYSPGADQLAITTGGTQQVTIDSSGRLLVGTSSARAYSVTPQIQLEGSAASPSSLSISRISTNASSSRLILAKARGTVVTPIIVSANDLIGFVSFEAFDGATFYQAATITGEVDGTPGANDMPGRLVFSTTTDGASSPTERLRIDSSGRLLVGTSSAGAGTSGITVQGSPGLFTLQLDATPSGAGTSLGTINFSNTAPGTGAQISCQSDAAWGSNDYPGRLVFSTTADGASSPTERFRISSTGAQSSVIPGGSTLYPVYDCRAWVNFNGTGTVAIRASGNVSSITDNGTGDYTVNFTSALADANYAATFGSAQESATVGGAACINDASVPTASALRIKSYSIGSSSNLAADKAYVHVSIFR